MEHDQVAGRPAPESKSVAAQLEKAAGICAGNGALLTELRRLVLRLTLEAEGAVTAYQLLDRLKEIRKGAVPPTIYRALDFLMEQRLVHKVERLNAYIPCVDADHPHHAAQFLICKKCGAVAEIEDHCVAQALERAAKTQHFRTESAVIELTGLCSACAAAG